MRHPTLFAASAFLACVAGLAQAAETAQANKSWQQGIHRTDLTRHDLHVPGQEVIQVRVDFDEGIASPKHSHPGAEVAYVIQGTFEYQLEGRAPVTLQAGESLYIPAGTAHVATNVGMGKASELATYIVSKQDPLLKIEQ